jgi:hypothetical protein
MEGGLGRPVWTVFKLRDKKVVRGGPWGRSDQENEVVIRNQGTKSLSATKSRDFILKGWEVMEGPRQEAGI